MSDAYQCDRCDDLFEGYPAQHVAHGPTNTAADERIMHADNTLEYCDDCWTMVAKQLNGEIDG